MASDGYVTLGDREVFNISRTHYLTRAYNQGSVRINPVKAARIADRFGDPADYPLITNAPWYDTAVVESSEFYGAIPLRLDGLDDSSLTATPREYTSDGGDLGKSRNGTQSIVVSCLLVAKTDRGAAYGLRWLNRVLAGPPALAMYTNGENLGYCRDDDYDDLVHRRQVRVTRGSTVTRKKSNACSTSWLVTFTLTAADPFEYGEPLVLLDRIGTGTVQGSYLSTGILDDEYAACPVYDYSPVYDPYNPALVPSPVAPNFYPQGWQMDEGLAFNRRWAVVRPDVDQPSPLDHVPLIRLRSSTDARMIRVSVFPGDASPDNQCDPLFCTVVTYMPADSDFYIDGERQASYIWDGQSTAVRRTDSLVYGPEASPVEWSRFPVDGDGVLVAIDTFRVTGSSIDPATGINVLPNGSFLNGLTNWSYGVNNGSTTTPVVGAWDVVDTPADATAQNNFGPKRARYSVKNDAPRTAYLYADSASSFDVVPGERIYVAGNVYVDGVAGGSLGILLGLSITRADDADATLIVPATSASTGSNAYPSNAGYVNLSGYLTIPDGFVRASLFLILTPQDTNTKNVYFGRAKASSARTMQPIGQVEMKFSVVSKSD